MTVLAAFALLKGMPGKGRAAEIIKLALLSAAMLYIMYLAGGKEIFRWEKGSLGKSIWLYKSMLIISLIIMFFTIIGNLADPSEMVREDCWIGLLTLIPHTLLIGLFEESAFRGLLMGGILAQTDGSRKGVFLALTVSWLVFGFLHVMLNITLNMSAAAVVQVVGKTLEAGMMGFVIGAVYLVTKNIWAAAILHGGVDYALMAISEVFGQELNGYVDTESMSALQDVPEDTAAVIVRHYFHGIPFGWIAEEKGLTRQTLHERKTAAFQTIRAGRYGAELAEFMPSMRKKERADRQIREDRAAVARLQLSDMEKELLAL